MALAFSYIAPTTQISISPALGGTIADIDESWLTPDDQISYIVMFGGNDTGSIRLGFPAPANIPTPSTAFPTAGGLFARYLNAIGGAGGAADGFVSVRWWTNGIEMPAPPLQRGDPLLPANLWTNMFFPFPHTFNTHQARTFEAEVSIYANTADHKITTISYGIQTDTPDNLGLFDCDDAVIGHGLRTRLCTICGFPFRENELTYRNGKLVCIVAGPKAFPCYDDDAYKETVITTPFNLGPRPDSGPFKTDPNS